MEQIDCAVNSAIGVLFSVLSKLPVDSLANAALAFAPVKAAAQSMAARSDLLLIGFPSPRLRRPHCRHRAGLHGRVVARSTNTPRMVRYMNWWQLTLTTLTPVALSQSGQSAKAGSAQERHQIIDPLGGRRQSEDLAAYPVRGRAMARVIH
jgi:hypothetical protein